VLGPFGTYILWPFCNLVVIWHIFLRFGILYQEKSGNPDQNWDTVQISPFPRCGRFAQRSPLSCRAMLRGKLFSSAFERGSLLLLFPIFMDGTLFSGSSLKRSDPGLPDGLLSNQKSQFGNNFQGLGLENVDIPILWPFGIFFEHLGYFMTIWHIVCSFVTFFPVLVSCTKKNLATLVRPLNSG
jgi:hypothetical protein